MAKFWGSRFKKHTDKLADQFSFSLSYDYRLAAYDCLVGMAHAKMLGACKIIPQSDAKKIVNGLQNILNKVEKGTFDFDFSEEDVHSNIQTVLKKLIGSAADKLHTARSRNDLIVTDMKLYCAVEQFRLIDQLTDLQQALVGLAEKHVETIIPAYTHLQAAQLVTLAHHLLAYTEMIERDKMRLFDSVNRLNDLPLGSGALSGTTLKTNRSLVAKELGFTEVGRNSMDAVSDRDFIIEALSNLAIVGVHFSRICEDLIIWSTGEFNFVSIDWAFCTGSSIMPHKKNPDICELIRGESAKLISNLNQILVLLKGLPLTYNRDLQLDKPPLFESIETVKMTTPLLTKIFATLKVNSAVLNKKIQDEVFYCVDIMEYLIRKGVSYREAHDTVGLMVKNCLDQGHKLSALPINQWKKYHKKFNEDVKKLLNPETSVRMKQSFGSTNPTLVKKQIDQWKKALKKNQK